MAEGFMTLYSTILFLHIASAIGLFYRLRTGMDHLDSPAPCYGPLRKSVPGSGSIASRRRCPGASLAVLILTGGYLASVIGAMRQGWMVASLAAVLVAFSMGFVLHLPRIRALRDSLASLGGTLPPDVAARLQSGVLSTSVRVRTMLAVGILYLMTAKTSLAVSFLALGIAVLLGLVFSIPAWSPTETAKKIMHKKRKKAGAGNRLPPARHFRSAALAELHQVKQQHFRILHADQLQSLLF